MAKSITGGSIAAPGFSGLNTQESGITLSSGFALQATNCVIDKYGRIGSRKGWTTVNATNSDLGTSSIKTIFEIQKSDGNVVISAGNNKLFTGTTTLTKMAVRDSTNSSDLAYTITADNWQIVSQPYSSGLSVLPHGWLVQAGHPVLIYHKLSSGGSHSHTGSYGFQRAFDLGTAPTGYSVTTFLPNVALAAYGRVWYADVSTTDRQTIYFSDLNNGSNMTTGTSGSLNIAEVVPDGEPITGLADHNGFLIIFTKSHTVVYSNAKDPSNLSLYDHIHGIGCIARDSIQNTGTDVLFLSFTGVRSLARTIQEKSAPMRDLSKNIRDDLIQVISGEAVSGIKSGYSPTEAFYLLSCPTGNIVYCFDTRAVLQDGSARVTTWNNNIPTAFCTTATNDLYLGQHGYIGKYTGYLDDTATYRMQYFTNYFDFEQPTSTKILKKLGIVAIGGSLQQVAVKWGFDYTENFFATSFTFPQRTQAQYNVAQYNIDEYAGGVSLSNVNIQAGGAGKVLQIGFESEINGTQLSIQKMDVFIKGGKTL